MGLQVWLPLNKELDNQGLGDITIVNNGMTVANGGKIGKCYTGGTYSYITLSEYKDYLQPSHSNSISIACWIKNTTCDYIIACEAFEYRCSFKAVQFRLGNGSTNTYAATSTIKPAADTWNHIVGVWDAKNKKVQVYLNGNKVGETTVSSSIKFNAIVGSTALPYDGTNVYLNDFRIYNEALSPKEIKELSKGLVMHCPLKDPYIEPPIVTSAEPIIEECSGYGYYGAVNKSSIPEYSEDSPRNKGCYYFRDNTKWIRLSTINMTGFANSYSFSWWGKIPNWENSNKMFWGFGDGNRLNLFQCRTWNTGDSNNNPFYIPGTTTQVGLPSANEWHHYVITGDGTTVKYYLDGALYGVAKTYKPLTGTTIYINGWNSSTEYKTLGYISDFRLYSTVLTEEDVKELYNSPIHILNTGAMMIQGELVEYQTDAARTEFVFLSDENEMQLLDNEYGLLIDNEC